MLVYLALGLSSHANMAYLTAYCFIYNHQYVFREGHSTEFTALELVDRVIQDMDKGNTPFNVYLAFEALDLSIKVKSIFKLSVLR